MCTLDGDIPWTGIGLGLGNTLDWDICNLYEIYQFFYALTCIKVHTFVHWYIDGYLTEDAKFDFLM
jgi:hypothetical protein